jgi:hypothetical protein
MNIEDCITPTKVSVGDSVITPLKTRARVVEIINDDECWVREDGICGTTMLVDTRVLLVEVN